MDINNNLEHWLNCLTRRIGAGFIIVHISDHSDTVLFIAFSIFLQCLILWWLLGKNKKRCDVANTEFCNCSKSSWFRKKHDCKNSWHSSSTNFFQGTDFCAFWVLKLFKLKQMAGSNLIQLIVYWLIQAPKIKFSFFLVYNKHDNNLRDKILIKLLI